MIERPIHDKWGSIIEITPEEFFQQDINYWRDMIYKRKILIFKKMIISKKQYVDFCSRFGKLWEKEDYRYSNEGSELVETDNGYSFISPFSSKTSKKLNTKSMPWHSDIPNRKINPYPFRSLWIIENPDPENSGKTSWLDLEESINHLPESLLTLAKNTEVVQQSWYEPGTDINEFPLIKKHPITLRESLRLNYFNDPKRNIFNAWIKGIKIEGKLQNDCSIIDDLLKYLEKIPELVYTHTWDNFDIAIYDNWSFVHSRTTITSDGNRSFYRVNIDHVDDTTWKSLNS